MKPKSTVWTFFAALALTLGFAPPSFAAISWSVTIAPPALPVYEQPVSPGADFIWTPGYWAWNGDDYYWVPGTWFLAPEPGLLWTPGYWGWRDGVYVFNAGYWGPAIGFYGGINYGFGYGGHGYDGGRWQNGHFFYNRSVSHVDETIVRNVYSETIVHNTTINHVSYSGGSGGLQAHPTAAETAAERERHIPPLATQTQHAEMARNNPQLRAAVNRGRPPIAATQRAAEFSGRAVVPARDPTPSHARDIAPARREAPPHTGNAALDKQYGQRQQEMYAKQDRERQALKAQQEADHERMTEEKANDTRRQQMEQEHLRQTQELVQRHAQEQQQMKEEQKRRRPGDDQR
jgi:hypothetical protein